MDPRMGVRRNKGKPNREFEKEIDDEVKRRTAINH